MVIINIQPIQVGNMEQYPVNAIAVQMNSLDTVAMVINVSCGLINIVNGNSTGVPDITTNFSLAIPVTMSMTLQQIIGAVGQAVLSYSPLFIKA